MTEPIDPLAVAVAVARVLEQRGILYTVGGSIASAIAGEPRSTIDVDMVAAIDGSHIPSLVSALESDFYVSADGLERAVRDRTSSPRTPQRSA